MRLMLLMSSALVLAMSGTSFAQEWTEFVSREDRFTITFPGQPTVTETTWTSQFSAILPARIYSGTQGSGRYSVTVVDYNPIERLLTERSRSLPALDLAVHAYGPGYWKTDVRSAVVYATSKFLERDAKITSMISNFSDLVAGLLVELTNNAINPAPLRQCTCTRTGLLLLRRPCPRISAAVDLPAVAWMARRGRDDESAINSSTTTSRTPRNRRFRVVERTAPPPVFDGSITSF